MSFLREVINEPPWKQCRFCARAGTTARHVFTPCADKPFFGPTRDSCTLKRKSWRGPFDCRARPLKRWAAALPMRKILTETTLRSLVLASLWRSLGDAVAAAKNFPDVHVT